MSILILKMNNSLLSFSHVINNHSQSLSLLNKHASDINSKLKIIEQKVKDIEAIQNKLQNFIVSSEGSKTQASSGNNISEDRIKIIVKEYVDIALANMLESKSTPLQNTVSLAQTQNISPVQEYNDNLNVFAQLEKSYTNTPLFTEDDDMNIIERKVKKPVGRKPKAK